MIAAIIHQHELVPPLQNEKAEIIAATVVGMVIITGLWVVTIGNQAKAATRGQSWVFLVIALAATPPAAEFVVATATKTSWPIAILLSLTMPIAGYCHVASNVAMQQQGQRDFCKAVKDALSNTWKKHKPALAIATFIYIAAGVGAVAMAKMIPT